MPTHRFAPHCSAALRLMLQLRLQWMESVRFARLLPVVRALRSPQLPQPQLPAKLHPQPLESASQRDFQQTFSEHKPLPPVQVTFPKGACSLQLRLELQSSKLFHPMLPLGVL
jgi:hypothetical protein